MILFYKKINGSIWLEWLFRLFLSAEFIQTAVAIPAEDYPSECWLLIFIAIWCYFFKLKLFGLVPLVFSVLMHYWHNPPSL